MIALLLFLLFVAVLSLLRLRFAHDYDGKGSESERKVRTAHEVREQVISFRDLYDTSNVQQKRMNSTSTPKEHKNIKKPERISVSYFQRGWLVCSECGWTFSSENGAQNHVATVHQRSWDESAWPRPPVDSPGRWITRIEFANSIARERKSFGYFECRGVSRERRCQSTWISAHAWANYRQQCKHCCNDIKPALMWLNDRNGEKRKRRNDEEEDAPHRQDLCEKCKMLGHSCCAQE